MKRAWFLVILVFLSCATSTSLVRVRDERIGQPQFHKILISAPYEDLQIRSSVEGLFSSALGSKQVACVRAMDVLPPLRSYEPGEISSVLRENGIQAVLVVAVTDFWTTQYSTPGRVITDSKTTSQVQYDPWSRMLSINSTTRSSSQYVPGITLTQSNVSLDVRLFEADIDNDPQMIWRANSTTSGNYFTPDSRVLSSAADQVHGQLLLDGFLLPEPAGEYQLWNGDLMVVSGPQMEIQLGCLTCSKAFRFSDKSIYARTGEYGIGAKYSVWNRKGRFASDTSDCSVCNLLANNPPYIVDNDGKVIGRLSLNPAFPSNYKDTELREWLLNTICKRRE